LESDVLAELHVRDLALIEDVWLEFGSGLTVLSGETGAGKTVLVSALKLLLGERADSTMVRQGAAEAVVEGRFLIDGREIVARRRVSVEGRSRCSVDGEMATVTMLAETLGPIVDLHGQHEHQALLSPAHHGGYLDRYIGDDAAESLRRYREARGVWREAAARLDELREALADREQRADYLRFVIGDIDAVQPQAGEDEELTALLPRLRYGERLAEASYAAWQALKEERGASDGLSAALAALGGVRGLDPALDGFAETISRLDIELQELATQVHEYAESIDHDADALDAAEGRLHRIEGLTRKYGGTVEAVLAARQSAAAELEMLDSGEAGLAEAERRVEEAAALLREAAEDLRAVRDAGVAPFVERLGEAASDLALKHAEFGVERTALPFESWTVDGPERVEFLFTSAAGEPLRPLSKVASGGEVSRVMLALKGVLGEADAVPVLVFDEVDAGIGGATAQAVGERLASLARSHQVLVVTHLAQVAAYADVQMVVEKQEHEGRTVTTVRHVAGEERVAEVARMLSGGTSETGIAHARELLSSRTADMVRG
jgi:DNA repair protein RecN (Recombination protein N)